MRISDWSSDVCSSDLLAGGNRIGNRGFFHEPTVLGEVPLDAAIMNEEPFGPVALINPMAGETAMVEEANRLPYGLAAYAWTSDPARRMRLANVHEAAMIDCTSASVRANDAASGGAEGREPVQEKDKERG